MAEAILFELACYLQLDLIATASSEVLRSNSDHCEGHLAEVCQQSFSFGPPTECLIFDRLGD